MGCPASQFFKGWELFERVVRTAQIGQRWRESEVSFFVGSKGSRLLPTLSKYMIEYFG